MIDSQPSLTFDPRTDPRIGDHQLDGVPLVPATVLLESCLRKIQAAVPTLAIREVDGFEVLRGVRFYHSAPQTLTLKLDSTEPERMRFELTGPYVHHRTGERMADVAYVRGSVRCRTPVNSAETPEFPVDWIPLARAVSARQFDPREVGSVYHGPALSALTAIAEDYSEGAWFRIETPGGGCSGDRPGPVVLDAVLQGCDVHATRHGNNGHLPSSIGSLQFLNTGSTECNLFRAQVRLCSQTSRELRYDASLWTGSGECAALLEGVIFLRRRSTTGQG